MPAETFPTGSTQQPESDGERQLVNYSERQEYLGRNATVVAIEVFGKDLRQSGIFFAEAGSDFDVPYRVECHGDGHIVTFNLYRSGIYEGSAAGHRGLDGYVITPSKAQRLATT